MRIIISAITHDSATLVCPCTTWPLDQVSSPNQLLTLSSIAPSYARSSDACQHRNAEDDGKLSSIQQPRIALFV